MEKKRILKIHLHIDYEVGGKEPLKEKHTFYEVKKETANRIYFTSVNYVDKEYFGSIRGFVECVKNKDSNTYKGNCNLSVYCHPEDVLYKQRLIRAVFIERCNQLKKTIDGFANSFAHDEILNPNNNYIVVEEDSTIVK